jgi:hypothetical protein
MNNETPSPEKVYRLMTSRADALDAIDAVVGAAHRELCIFDSNARTLRDRDFGSPARIEILHALLLSNRGHRLRVVLHDVKSIEIELPRLIELLTRFAGQFEIRRTVGQAAEARDPMVIADSGHFWRQLHIDQPRSVLTLHDEIATRPFIDRFEEIWEMSELAVSGSTLGL